MTYEQKSMYTFEFTINREYKTFKLLYFDDDIPH